MGKYLNRYMQDPTSSPAKTGTCHRAMTPMGVAGYA